MICKFLPLLLLLAQAFASDHAKRESAGPQNRLEPRRVSRGEQSDESLQGIPKSTITVAVKAPAQPEPPTTSTASTTSSTTLASRPLIPKQMPLEKPALTTHHEIGSSEQATKDVLKELVLRFCQMPIDEKSGTTMLHEMAATKCQCRVRALLEAKAPVHVYDSLGRTPLHLAVSGERMPVVEVLVAARADVNASKGSALKPLQIAKAKKNYAIMQLLIDAKADPSLLEMDDLKQLKLITKKAAKPVAAAEPKSEWISWFKELGQGFSHSMARFSDAFDANAGYNPF